MTFAILAAGMFDLFARFFVRHILMLVWLLVTVVPLLIVVEVVRPGDAVVNGPIGIAVIVAWILCSFWLAGRTMRQLDNGKHLLPAMRCTLNELRQRLALMPLVGAWFRSRDQNHKDKPDD